MGGAPNSQKLTPFLHVSVSCLGSAFSFHSNRVMCVMGFHKVHVVLICDKTIHGPNIICVDFNVTILTL